MAEFEKLNDEAVEAVTGGINTTDWTRAHWQPTNVPMGSPLCRTATPGTASSPATV